jgi:hypothetical protein
MDKTSDNSKNKSDSEFMDDNESDNNRDFYVLKLAKINEEKAKSELAVKNWKLLQPLHSNDKDILFWLVSPSQNATSGTINETLKAFSTDWLISWLLDELIKVAW